ncbi:MAG: FtsX-like permease family protein [Albidovulum sp.]|nr:FtsX-like permease family protein [Albidovulum sp.]
MARATPPFAAFEWWIAWRYLRAKRKEGGISVMVWISLMGVAIAVFALIATLAVRTGFRTELVGTILGANPHATLISRSYGRQGNLIDNFDEIAEGVAAIEGVTRAMPVIRSQALASFEGRNAGVEVVGIRRDDLLSFPLIAEPEVSYGDLADFGEGIAIGTGVARALNAGTGHAIRLVNPDGAKTAFGVSPRVNSYRVAFIFGVGRYDIDRVRVYLPFEKAQIYYEREGVADEIQIFVEDPERIDGLVDSIMEAGGGLRIWTWKDASGAFLTALQMEDNIMFIILSVLVVIATSNIVSGLVMLVKNKGRDIGILRTIGLSEGSILRVFFICGISIGAAGTAIGVVLGSLFAIFIDPIFEFVNMLAGGGVWDPRVRYLSTLPSKLTLPDVLSAVGLSLGLSLVVTILPARRAARLDPLESLRYE